MAILKINLPKIIYNIATLDEIFRRHDVGDTIKFQVNYMALAKLMTSRYIEKVIIETTD